MRCLKIRPLTLIIFLLISCKVFSQEYFDIYGNELERIPSDDFHGPRPSPSPRLSPLSRVINDTPRALASIPEATPLLYKVRETPRVKSTPWKIATQPISSTGATLQSTPMREQSTKRKMTLPNLNGASRIVAMSPPLPTRTALSNRTNTTDKSLLSSAIYSEVLRNEFLRKVLTPSPSDVLHSKSSSVKAIDPSIANTALKTSSTATIYPPSTQPTKKPTQNGQTDINTKVADNNITSAQYPAFNLSTTVTPDFHGNVSALGVKMKHDTTMTSPVITKPVTIAIVLSIGLIIVLLAFILRMWNSRKRRCKLREDLSMTGRDARLSSTFLQDIPTSGRPVKMESFAIPMPESTQLVSREVLAASSPVPAKMSLTSPRGTKRPLRRSSLYNEETERRHSSEFIRVKLEERQRRPALSLSNPNLIFDDNAKHLADQHEYIRRHALLLSDEEDAISQLRKSKKRRWKIKR